MSLMEMEKLLAEMDLIGAKLNRVDRKEIGAYKETLFEIIPLMLRLKEELRKVVNMGFRREAEFKKFRFRMGNVMTNSVRIMRKLKQVTDDQGVKNEIGAMESTLVAIYNVLNSSPGKGVGGVQQVESDIRRMDLALAQLNSVEKKLEVERLWLKRVNLERLLKIVLERPLGNVGGIKTLTSAPSNKMEGLMARKMIVEKAWEAVSGHEYRKATPISHSPAFQADLERIGKGNPLAQ